MLGAHHSIERTCPGKPGQTPHVIREDGKARNRRVELVKQ